MGLFGMFRNKKKVAPPDPTTETKPSTTQGIPESELVPLVGRIPFPAYRGDDPFIFISYAHANASEVFSLIKQFYDQGYHVWYDEGIAPGNEWTDEIADALERASLFLVFISPESQQSPNVRDEINFALNDNKPFVAIYLSETQLSGGLKLRMGMKQAILKYSMTDEEFLYKYTFAFKNLGLPVPPQIARMGETFGTERASRKSVAKPTVAPAPSIAQTTASAPTPAPKPTPAHTPKQTDSPIPAPTVTRAQPAAVAVTGQGFVPRGTATIVSNDTTWTVPANSLFSMAAYSIFLHPKTEWTHEDGELPAFREIRELTARPFPDENEYHRVFTVVTTGGDVIEKDRYTSFSWLGFLDRDRANRLPWSRVDSITIDWSKSCMERWPEYARLHRRTGEVELLPAFSLTMAKHNRPKSDNYYDSSLSWPWQFKTRRGTSVSLGELSSICFGPVTYDADRREKDWIKELPVGLVYKDGRQLSSFVEEDDLRFFALDEFGVVSLLIADIDHIDFVANGADEAVVMAPPQSQLAVGPQKPSLPDTGKKHAWGDFEPKGVAHITLKDGGELRGVANSFVLMAKHMEKRALSNECLYTGMDTPDTDADYDLSNMKQFLEMVSIEAVGDLQHVGSAFEVTDMEDQKVLIKLPQEAQFWFISEDNEYEPTKVAASDVQRVEFRRTETVSIPVRLCTVHCKEGSFRSPTAFLSVLYNVGSGIPSMRLGHDFSKFVGFPVRARNTQTLVVTKNANSAGGFGPSESIELVATLKNGEDVEFSMDGYFAIKVMSRFGMIRDLSRASFLGIDFA